MDSFKELNKKIVKWAERRSIFEKSTPADQYVKLNEESRELGAALLNDLIAPGDHKEDVLDAVGDMMVVLSIISHMYATDLHTCYAKAYDQIKDRKGKVIGGIFVKEEDQNGEKNENKI